MKFEQNRHRLESTVLSLTLLLVFAAPIAAQEGTKPMTGTNWRPKSGTYAVSGKDFEMRCGEYGDLAIELDESSIGGSEWGCKVNKITDTAPGAISVDMTCNDYNLAEFIHDPNPEQRKFKETILLKKINETTVSVRKTLNGKFSVPTWQASYCPGKAQRMYREGKRRDSEEKKARAATSNSSKPALEKWLPKDGVYASPGADFNDRCATSADVVLELTKKSVSSGKAKCKVSSLDESTSDTDQSLSLVLACDRLSGKKFDVWRKLDGPAALAKPSRETMILRKVDDKTFFLTETEDGKFIEPGGPVSYCPDEMRRSYIERKNEERSGAKTDERAQ